MIKTKTIGKRELFLSYILPFSALFVIVQYFVFFVFYRHNITFIWNYDGVHQHYPALSYYSSLLKNLLSGKGLSMVDFSIGQGFDVITTLNYYVIGDPLTVLAGIWDPNHLETLYDLLVILRFYLAGVSFLAFCIYKKKAPFPALLGAFIYVFSGYSLFAGLRHPFFLNPMIYLPLLFIGVEQLLKYKRSIFFSIMIAISAMSNFYFLYMLSVIIFIYALVRFYDCYKEERIKNFFLVVSKSVLYYLLGILLSAVLLLPMIYAFMNNGRIEGASQAVNLFLYPMEYYKLLYQNLLSLGFQAGHWSYISVGVVGALCACAALMREKKNRTVITLLIISVVFMCIPLFGYFMNGFSYVANRWTFVFAFLIAYIVADSYESIFELSRKKRFIILAISAIYCITTFLFMKKYSKLPALFLVAGAGFVVFSRYYKIKPIYRNLIFLVLCIVNIVSSSYLFYSGRFNNYSSAFLTKGTIKEYEHNDAVEYIKSIDDSFYRIQIDDAISPNIAMPLNVNGTGFYFSILNSNVFNYMFELENSSLRFACQYEDNNERAAMNALSSVKYYITKRTINIPFGYKELKTDQVFEDGTRIYINEYYLPLGFTYNSYITSAEYEKLTALQKQEALMQSVVLEEDTDVVPKKSLEFTSKELPVTFILDEGMTLEGNTLHVTNPNSLLYIKTKGRVFSETYLHLENLQITDPDVKRVGLVSVTKRWRINKFGLRTPEDNNYFGVSNYLINLGYKSKAMRQIKLYFKEPGTYEFDSIKVYAQPMKYYINQALQLKETVLEDVVESTNRISGKVNTTSPTMLYLSIPYSKGWKATVDGKPAKLLKANTMYMALELPAGNHEIVLDYQTPYLKEGLMLSGLGIIITLSLVLTPYVKRKIIKKENA